MVSNTRRAIASIREALNTLTYRVSKLEQRPIVTIDIPLAQIPLEADRWHTSSSHLTVERYGSFNLGDRVQNVVTTDYYEHLGLVKEGYAACGIVIPRPSASPMYKDGHRLIYVLCDDGRVRGTRAENLRIIYSHTFRVRFLRQ